MPAEAHRLQRPIVRRDRRLIAAILTASGIAITAATLFAHYENPRRGSAQCVTYNDAGVMGGGTWNLCGVAALTLCNDNPAKSARLETQCAALRQQRQTSNQQNAQAHVAQLSPNVWTRYQRAGVRRYQTGNRS